MNILSIFDGISGAQVALNRLGLKNYNYYASEIDKYAIKITQANYPLTKQIGDVTKITKEILPDIDLLIGGSPCQGFSFAGKQLNFDDERSALFFEYVRILNEVKPKHFLLENVNMKKEYQDVISGLLGVKPIKINSALVSAQNRVRLYWTNIQVVDQPDDKNIFLNEIIENNVDEKYYLSEKLLNGFKNNKEWYKRFNPLTGKNKSFCLTARYFKMGRNDPYINDINGIRRLTPTECERLQTFPDNYTNHVSNTQRYKALGNSFTVDVIAHILGKLRKENMK